MIVKEREGLRLPGPVLHSRFPGHCSFFCDDNLFPGLGRIVGIGERKITYGNLPDQDRSGAGFFAVLLFGPGSRLRRWGRSEDIQIHLALPVLDQVDLPVGEEHFLHGQGRNQERGKFDFYAKLRDPEEVTLTEALGLGDPQIADRDVAAEQPQLQGTDRGRGIEHSREFPVGDPDRRRR